MVYALTTLYENNFHFSDCYEAEILRANWSKSSEFSIRMFVDSVCELDPNVRVPTIPLYKLYRRFCQETGLTEISSETSFPQELRHAYPLENGRWSEKGIQYRGLIGIAVQKKFEHMLEYNKGGNQIA